MSAYCATVVHTRREAEKHGNNVEIVELSEKIDVLEFTEVSSR